MRKLSLSSAVRQPQCREPLAERWPSSHLVDNHYWSHQPCEAILSPPTCLALPFVVKSESPPLLLSHLQTSAVVVHARLMFVVISHSRFAATFENFPQSSIVWHYEIHTKELHGQMVFDCAVILHIFDTEKVWFRFYCVAMLKSGRVFCHH